MVTDRARLRVSAVAAGLVNGCFGGGGGMVLVPLLGGWCGLAQKKAMATCVAAILPMCLLSVAVYALGAGIDWRQALPYLVGGALGGAVGGRLFRNVSAVWLRRLFALFTLYGGVRYLI